MYLIVSQWFTNSGAVNMKSDLQCFKPEILRERVTNTKIPPEDEPTTLPDDEPEVTPPEDELIDTGQLNWPVPVFTIAGLLIFSLGWSILKFSTREEEAV